MNGKFVRRSATGYYKPIGSLFATGLYHLNGFNDTTNKWKKVVSTDVFTIGTDSSLKMVSSDAHNDFMYRKDYTAAMTDQFSQFKWQGLTAGDFSLTVAGGGVTVRHNGTVWPTVSGYYFLIEETSFTGSPVYSWSMGRYAGSGISCSRTVITSGSFTPSVGDLFRIEVTGSAPPSIVVKQNGSTLTSGTDTNPTPFTSGYPGLIGGTDAVSSNSWFSWSDWAGGPLVPVIPTVPNQWRGSGYWLGVR